MGIGILLTVIGPFQGVRYFSPEARETLAAISLSLLCLFIAARVVFLMTSDPPEQTSRKRRWLPGPATRVVMAAALAGGLMLTVFSSYLPAVPKAWQHQGLYRSPQITLSSEPLRPATREARIAGLTMLAEAVSKSLARQSPASSRDEIRGVSPELWSIPGQGGPAWLYLSANENAGTWLIAEPFVIDGEQLAWSETGKVHQVSAKECDAIAAQLRSVQ